MRRFVATRRAVFVRPSVVPIAVSQYSSSHKWIVYSSNITVAKIAKPVTSESIRNEALGILFSIFFPPRDTVADVLESRSRTHASRIAGETREIRRQTRRRRQTDASERCLYSFVIFVLQCVLRSLPRSTRSYAGLQLQATGEISSLFLYFYTPAKVIMRFRCTTAAAIAYLDY